MEHEVFIGTYNQEREMLTMSLFPVKVRSDITKKNTTSISKELTQFPSYTLNIQKPDENIL